MKTIFTLLALILSVTSAHADITAVGKQSIQGVELLSNPGFENGKARWTNVGGVFSIATSGSNFLGIGKSSATWQASGSGQYLESETVTVPVALQGKACGASFMTFGGDGNLQLQAYDNSNNPLGAALTLQAQTVATPAAITFRCPSSGGVKYRLQSTAASALIALDAGHLGDQGTYQVGTSQMYGAIKWNGSPCTWTTTSGSWTSYSAVGTCIAAPSVNASTPATNIPGITFASLPPGDYLVVYDGQFINSGSNSVSGGFRVLSSAADADGKTFGGLSSNGPSASLNGAGASGGAGSTRFRFTSSQSNITFQIQGYTTNGTGAQVVADTTSNNGGLYLYVYRFPNVTDTAYRADQTPASWSGFHTTTGTWAQSSGTLGDFGGVTVSTITQRNSRNFGSVQAAGLLPGITLSFPRPGNYWVCVGGNGHEGTSSGNAVLSLADDLGTVISNPFIGAIAANTGTSFNVCGVYNAASTATRTIKLQGKTSGGTFQLNWTTGSNPLEWSIVELDAPMAMPFVLNQVTSGNANGERVERVTVGTVCSSTPCTITSQSSSWLTSVTRTGLGQYDLNFAAGIFSAPPVCFAISLNGGTGANSAKTSGVPTTSLVEFRFTQSGTANDDNFAAFCFGPK